MLFSADNKSVSTDSEPYRVQMARYMQSWSHLIMSRQDNPDPSWPSPSRTLDPKTTQR